MSRCFGMRGKRYGGADTNTIVSHKRCPTSQIEEQDSKMPAGPLRIGREELPVAFHCDETPATNRPRNAVIAG